MIPNKEKLEGSLIAAQDLKESIEERIEHYKTNVMYQNCNSDNNSELEKYKNDSIAKDEKLLAEVNEDIKGFTKKLENLN